jgi:hypothetical protein
MTAGTFRNQDGRQRGAWDQQLSSALFKFMHEYNSCFVQMLHSSSLALRLSSGNLSSHSPTFIRAAPRLRLR